MTTDYEPQPAWGGEPAPAPVAPVAVATPRRSGWVTTSAVVLLVVGTLSALAGVLMIIIGIAFGSSFSDMFTGQPGVPENVNFEAVSGIMTGFIVGFAIIALLWAAGHVAAGVGILGGRAWGRITGIVLAAIGLALSALGIFGTLASAAATPDMMRDPDFAALYPGMSAQDVATTSIVTGMLFLLSFLIGYLIVLITMIRNGAFFDRPRVA